MRTLVAFLFAVLFATCASAQTTSTSTSTTSSTLPLATTGSVYVFAGVGSSGARAPIQAIVWSGCTTGGDAVVGDGTLGAVWTASCPLTDTTVIFTPTESVGIKQDVRVTTLTSGTVTVYLSAR